MVLKLILNYKFPGFVCEGIYFHPFFFLFSIFISFLFFCLSPLTSIQFSVALLFLCMTFSVLPKFFSSFSFSFFPDYYNLSSSLSSTFFFRYFIFCFLSFLLSLFFHIALFFALPLFFSVFLVLFCPLTLLVLVSSLSYFCLHVSINLFLLNFPFFRSLSLSLSLSLYIYIYIYSHFFSFIPCYLPFPFQVLSLFFPIQHLSLFISECLSPFISSKALAHSRV